MMYLESCDTFVALPPATDGCVIFGKNSDRPSSEVQELIHVSAADYPDGSTVQCTYLAIPQAAHTHGVVLSKPAWMWGAEMGANEHGVCIGNEAVWTKMLAGEDNEEKLLGMDLVRLGLERGATAREALDVITGLLVSHGQGGRCYEDPDRKDVKYHNSFILVDGVEAWVLETAGRHWAAQKVSAGVRNISNLLSITKEPDLMSAGLKEEAESKGFWVASSGDFSFAEAFQAPIGVLSTGNTNPQHRFTEGKKLMEQHANGGFRAPTMFDILRDLKSGICVVGEGGAAATMGSQVSVIYPSSSGRPSCHWFTVTPNPSCSVFKPFIFCPGVDIGTLTVSPTFANDPAKACPRFGSQVDRRHALYRAHERVKPLPGSDANERLVSTLQELETQCVNDMEEFLTSYNGTQIQELPDLFKDIVEAEVKFYQ